LKKSERNLTSEYNILIVMIDFLIDIGIKKITYVRLWSCSWL